MALTTRQIYRAAASRAAAYARLRRTRRTTLRKVLRGRGGYLRRRAGSYMPAPMTPRRRRYII